MLAADERVRDCLVLKPVQFALGRALDAADTCTLAAVRDAAVRDDGLRYQDVLRGLVLQRGFRTILTAE